MRTMRGQGKHDGATPKPRLTTILCGVAGEYLVAAELSRRGYVATLTLRNTRGIDILAANSDATRSVGIQVKTNQGNRPEWMLNKKAETDIAENLFYVFVRLNQLGTPSYHVVPRRVVARFILESHQAWLRTPGTSGKPHVDTPMRKFMDREDEYRDQWGLLGLGGDQ